MAETFKKRYDVQVSQIWGMTETTPLGVVSTPTPALAALGEEAMDESIWSRQGRLQFGIELRIVGDLIVIAGTNPSLAVAIRIHAERGRAEGGWMAATANIVASQVC